jgi:chromosome segregation ATPase
VLEERLREERDKHSTTKEAAMRLEQENLDAQKEMNGLLIRQGEATEEIRRLEMALKRKDSFSISPVRDVESSHRVKELEHVLEEKKRSVCSLEDHISTLKFHLEQKSTELEDARKLLVLNTDKNEGILEQMRRSQESLRVELAQQVQSAELLAEERSSYRGQVLEMNSALKNSLAHIKDLRSKASDYPVVLQHSVVDVDPLAELMLRRSAPTTSTGIATSSGRNISSLQNCLASVKAEMMILQSKLAPRTDSRASLSPDYWRGDAAAAPSVGDDADKTKSEFVEIDGASSSN